MKVSWISQVVFRLLISLGAIQEAAFIRVFMSPVIDFEEQQALSESLVLALLLVGFSSLAVRFVLIMWFDLIP